MQRLLLSRFLQQHLVHIDRLKLENGSVPRQIPCISGRVAQTEINGFDMANQQRVNRVRARMHWVVSLINA